MIRVRGFGSLGGDARQQALAKGLGLLLDFGNRFLGFRRLLRRPRHRNAFGLPFRAQRFEPVAQGFGRAAVVLVVALHGIANLGSDGGGRVRIERELHGEERLAHALELDPSCVTGILFELLDGIALDPGAHGLPGRWERDRRTAPRGAGDRAPPRASRNAPSAS